MYLQCTKHFIVPSVFGRWRHKIRKFVMEIFENVNILNNRPQSLCHILHMVTVEIVINSNHIAQHFALHLAYIALPSRWCFWYLVRTVITKVFCIWTGSNFDALQKFSQFLRLGITSEDQLVRILQKVEGYLRQKGTRFMLSDNLSRADCYLLPTLQHIRVAGKVEWFFTVSSVVHIWDIKIVLSWKSIIECVKSIFSPLSLKYSNTITDIVQYWLKISFHHRPLSYGLLSFPVPYFIHFCSHCGTLAGTRQGGAPLCRSISV